MKPFCANPMCLANNQQVEDDEVHLEGKLNNGLDISLGRVFAVNEKKKMVVPFCTACANVFTIIRGETEPARIGKEGMGSFCANTECFLHNAEVPDDQGWIEISLGGSSGRRMEREWLMDKYGHNDPFCSSCANIFNIILGEPEYPDADEGFCSDVVSLDENSPILM